MSTQPPTLRKPSVAAAGSDHDALPPGTRFGEFEIQRVLGVGGFGIVYLARDDSLEREVALKEYMPASLAARGAGPQITVRSSAFAETYAIGLRSFINEARLLARFDHPSLVKVYRFWEDNATAYMVMPFLQGTTLRDTRRRMAHPPDEAWIRSVLAPILSALELLHREGVYHRDIAPDNILLPRDAPPVLLDFGAARRVISDRTQSLTAILKPSYAPIEQYAEMTQLRQGPWTDLYALGAVVHYLVFGVPPAPATARAVAEDGDAIENRVVAGISPRFLEAMSWMLAVRPNHRPQSGEQLRAVLDGNAEIPPRGPSGTTIPGAFPSTQGPNIEQAADATRLDPASVPTHMPAAAARSSAATTSFSPTTQMPTARTTPLVGRDPPLAASLAPQTPSAVAASRPATLAPGASGPPTRPPAAEHASSRPAATPAPSRPASLAAAAAPRAARPKQWIALVGGGVVALIAVAAAIQFAGRREGPVAAPAASAAAASPNIVPVPSTVPAAMSTGPSELILEAPQGKPIEGKPVPPLPPADAGVAARSATGERTTVPIDAAQAASGTRARPPGRPVPKVDDAVDGAAGSNAARSGDASSLGAAGATQPRPPGQPAVPRDPHVAQRPPQPTTQGEPQTAAEACAKLGGGFFARNVCLDEKCEEARYRNLGECPAVLARKRQREH